MLQKHVLDIVLEQRGERLHLSWRDRARVHTEYELRYLGHIGDVIHGGAERDHLIGHGLGLVGKDRNQALALSLYKLLLALVPRQRRVAWIGVGGGVDRGGAKSHECDCGRKGVFGEGPAMAVHCGSMHLIEGRTPVRRSVTPF